jgi:DNA-binding HxlR family transcriptional regulator
MSGASYAQFCPLSMAAEILCTRWTPLVLRELLNGTTRFNDFRRGVPKMSPALLSKRLKELEFAGVIETRPNRHGIAEYHLTEAGEELRPFVDALAMWGHVWIDSKVTLSKLDPSLLMWDIRRKIRPEPPISARRTVQFLYPDLAPADRSWWLVVERQDVELCYTDPGYDIDVLVTASLRSITGVWMGLSVLSEELASGRVRIDGEPALARAVGGWLGQHPISSVPRRVP